MIIVPLAVCFSCIVVLLLASSERRAAAYYGLLPLTVIFLINQVAFHFQYSLLGSVAVLISFSYLSLSFLLEELYRYVLARKIKSAINFFLSSLFIILAEATEKIIVFVIGESEYAYTVTISGIIFSTAVHLLNSSMIFMSRNCAVWQRAIVIIVASIIHFSSNIAGLEMYVKQREIYIIAIVVMFTLSIVFLSYSIRKEVIPVISDNRQ